VRVNQSSVWDSTRCNFLGNGGGHEFTIPISSVLDVRNKTNNDILTFSQNKLTLFLLIKKTRVHISHRYSHPASQATFKRSLLILVLHVLLNA
jgi:hypothetical protein